MRFDFLALHPEAFGLDLSDLSLKILKLKRKGRRIRVASWGTFPIPPGLIEQGEIKNQEETLALLKLALRNVQGERLGTPYVVSSLPEEKAFLQVIQLPRMEAKDVVSAVTFQAENYIPYPPDSVYLDASVAEPLKDRLDHTDALIASMPKPIVEGYVALLEKAGLFPKVLEIESLAQARALIPGQISQEPLLLADLGATRTSLFVFAGRTVRLTASLPTSSRDLTKAIAKHCDVGLDTAEKLKMEYGLKGGNLAGERLSPPERDIAKKVQEALGPILETLAQEMKNYFDFYELHASHGHLPKEQAKIQKVLLSGGGAALVNLPEFLTKGLRKEVALGNPWVNIMESSPRELPPIPFQESLGYTTALGLALRALSPHD